MGVASLTCRFDPPLSPPSSPRNVLRWCRERARRRSGRLDADRGDPGPEQSLPAAPEEQLSAGDRRQSPPTKADLNQSRTASTLLAYAALLCCLQSVRGPALFFTDEELRTGDPIDTLRRATMAPGQLSDSLASRRLSFMTDLSDARAHHRLSLMPGQLSTRTSAPPPPRSPRVTKRSSSAVLQPSPEVCRVGHSAFISSRGL